MFIVTRREHETLGSCISGSVIAHTIQQSHKQILLINRTDPMYLEHGLQLQLVAFDSRRLFLHKGTRTPNDCFEQVPEASHYRR